MFDFAPDKLILIGVIALIVIGPKDLPRVLRQLGQLARKMSRMAAEFRGQFLEAMREAELEDLKAEAEKLTESTKIGSHFNPLAEVKASITSALQEAEKPKMASSNDIPSSDSIVALHTSNDYAERESQLTSDPTLISSKVETLAALNGNSPFVDRTQSEMRALADALAAEIDVEKARLASGEARRDNNARQDDKV